MSLLAGDAMARLRYIQSQRPCLDAATTVVILYISETGNGRLVIGKNQFNEMKLWKRMQQSMLNVCLQVWG
jgi:hypothetical protein